MKATRGFSIRAAKEDDFIEIEKLAFSIFPNSSILFSAADRFFIARAGDGRLIGFSHLCLSSKSAELQGIGVLPEFRKMGIGKSLVAAVLSYLQKQNPGMPVKLKVLPENFPAISLYLKDGFILEKDEGDSFRLVKAGPN